MNKRDKLMKVLKYLLFNNMFIHKDIFFTSLVFGIDRVFTLRLFKRGCIFEVCHLGTILKKYEITICLFPFSYNKYNI